MADEDDELVILLPWKDFSSILEYMYEVVHTLHNALDDMKAAQEEAKARLYLVKKPPPEQSH